jgi:hypothetical protein
MSGEKKKGKVLASDFIDWFISDEEDLIYWGNRMLEDLKIKGSFSCTIRTLFNDAGYIPSHLVKDGFSEEDCQSEDLEFIDDITPLVNVDYKFTYLDDKDNYLTCKILNCYDDKEASEIAYKLEANSSINDLYRIEYARI